MDLLKSWQFHKERKVARQRLEHYPPYRAPYPGLGSTLQLEQAQANLEYLLANRPRRLEILGEYLDTCSIDIRDALTAANVQPLLDELHRWKNREWPKLHDKRLTTLEVAWNTSREGPQIVYSMLMDVAILLGEMILARRPEYSWSLDLEPENGPNNSDHPGEAMVSFRRPVVQRPKGGPFPMPIIFDVEDIVAGEYRNADTPVLGIPNNFARLVHEAVSGAHERFWIEEQARNAAKT